ncbi:hypothetical protein D046_6529B, partial [Vibrio parahaemolyticus V-223/04]
YHGAGPA